jgi:hypothetical protein
MKSNSPGTSASNQFISAIFASKTPEGLTLKEYSWENEYQGTEEAFIKSGFIKPEWLPGKPGNAKTRVSVGLTNGEMVVISKRSLPTDYQWDNGFISISRSGKQGLKVSIFCLKEERERREEIDFAQARQNWLKDIRAEIDKSLSCLPTSSGSFMQKQLNTVRAFTTTARNSLTDGFGYNGGYSFSAEALEAFDVAVANILQLIQESRIHFDPEVRKKEISDIKNRVWEKYPGIADKREDFLEAEERRVTQ